MDKKLQKELIDALHGIGVAMDNLVKATDKIGEDKNNRDEVGMGVVAHLLAVSACLGMKEHLRVITKVIFSTVLPNFKNEESN